MGIKSFFAKQARKPSGLFGRIFTGILLNKANASLEDMGLKLMNPEPDSTILEIGFGNGRLISRMGEVITNGKITGIDISKEMITQAKKKNIQLINSGKLELIEASVEDIPAGDENFDKIFTANTIYFWPNPDENIKEITRTLKPGGKFYCALRLKDEMKNNKMIGSNLRIFKNLFSKNDIKTFLERSEFKDVTVYTEEDKYTNVIAVGSKA